MSKKDKKKVENEFTYDLVSKNGVPVRTYDDDIKQPIKTSGMAAVSTGWALIFGVLLPVFLWWLLQFNVMGAMDTVCSLGLDSMKDILPFLPFVLTLITFIVFLVVRAKGAAVKYKVQDTMIVQIDKDDKKEVCKLLLRPGMSVSLRRTLKGKLFGYADVVINVAVGADHSEVVLHNVKNYKKVRKLIKSIIHDNCLVSTRSMVFNV